MSVSKKPARTPITGAILAKIGKQFWINGVSGKNLEDFSKDKEEVKSLSEKVKYHKWRTMLLHEAGPKGIRIEFIGDIKIDYNRLHEESIKAGAPQTDPKGEIFSIAGEYKVPENKTVSKETYVLVQLVDYPQQPINAKHSIFKSSVAWAHEHDLVSTLPSELFAVCEQRPRINNRIGLGGWDCTLVETAGYTSAVAEHACTVEYSFNKRVAKVIMRARLTGQRTEWLLFRKKP
jgi:hypothetical protein